MAKKPLPTPDELRQLLDYDPETGVLTWRERPLTAFADERTGKAWNRRWAKKRALTAYSNGYKCGNLMSRRVQAHSVAWAIYHGAWPVGDIDHVSGDRADNRISNLRLVSRVENMRNAKRSRANTSGVTGVSFDGQTNKWRAKIGLPGPITLSLGRFDNIEDAIAARKRAEARHGFHEHHGREHNAS